MIGTSLYSPISGWSLELLSLLVSALAVGATVITLGVHNGQLLPNWPFDITLNTLLSVLSQTGQMTLMIPVTECISQLKWIWFARKKPIKDFEGFDQASRGPIGSLLLFSKLRGIYHLPSLGALITILALAFGPFTQEVVTYPSRLTPVLGSTQIPVSAPGIVSVSTSLDLDPNSPYVDPIMTIPDVEASIFEGIFQPNVSLSDAAATCGTGNCTFASYPSLGICASVIDISKHLQLGCSPVPTNMTFFGNDVCVYDTIDTTCTHNCTCFDCGYSLPNSQYLSIGSGITDKLSIQPAGSFALNNTASILDATVIGYVLNNTWGNFNQTFAIQFNLQFCIQVYNTTVFNGLTNTTEITRYTDLGGMIYSNITFAGPDGPRQDIRVHPNPDLTNGTQFKINFYPWGAIKSSVGAIFIGDSTSIIDFQENLSYPGIAQFYQQVISPNIANLETPEFNSSFIGNASDFMDNLALSLTNALRTGPDSFPYPGTALVPMTYVNVQWVWLVLPIGIVALTAILLLATMTQSRRHGIEPWKSSSLAALNGLSSDMRTDIGPLYSIHEMEDKLKRIQVRSESDKLGGWRLVKV